MSDRRRRSHHHPRVTILDGGVGHELKVRGISDGTFVAGLLANQSRPDLVRDVHRDYFSVGCDVVTTNSFVAVPERMVECGLAPGEDADAAAATSRARAAELIVASVDRAREAVAGSCSSGTENGKRVAGCVPPLTECYVAADVPDGADEMVPAYELILSTLLCAGVDLLLAETLSTSREALAVVRALSNVVRRGTGPARSVLLWLSFTIDDDNPLTLRSGEELDSAAAAVLRAAAAASGVNLRSIGVNCASPRAISEAVPRLVSVARRASSDAPPPEVIAYGNAFRTTTSDWLRSVGGDGKMGGDEALGVLSAVASSRLDSSDEYDETGCMLPEVYAQYARAWVDAGASIVGGCCGCGPRHMRAVVNELRSPISTPRWWQQRGFRSKALNLLRCQGVPVPPFISVSSDCSRSMMVRHFLSSLLMHERDERTSACNYYTSIVVSHDNPVNLLSLSDSDNNDDKECAEYRVELSLAGQEPDQVVESLASAISATTEGSGAVSSGEDLTVGGTGTQSADGREEHVWIVRASASNGRIGLLLRRLPTLVVHVAVDSGAAGTEVSSTSIDENNAAGAGASGMTSLVKGAWLKGSHPVSTKPFGIDPGSPQHHWGLDLLWQLGKIYCYSGGCGSGHSVARGGPYPSDLHDDQDGWEKVRWGPGDGKRVFGVAVDAARALLVAQDGIWNHPGDTLGGGRRLGVLVELELTFGSKCISYGANSSNGLWRATFDDSPGHGCGAFSDLLDVSVVGAFPDGAVFDRVARA